VGIAHPLNGSRLRRGPGIRQGCFEIAVSNLAFLFFPNAPATTEAPPKPCRNWVSQWGSGRPPFFRPPSLPLPLPLPPPPLPHFPVAAAPAQAPCPREGCRRSVESGRGPGFAPTAPGLGRVRLRSLQLSVSQWSLHLSVSQGPFASVGQSVVFASVGRSVARGLLSHSVSPWSWPRSVGRSGSSESFGQSVVFASVGRSLGVF